MGERVHGHLRLASGYPLCTTALANNSPNPTPETNDDELALAVLVKRLALGIVVLFSLVVVLSLTLREPLEVVSAWFVDQFGLAGVLASTFLLDAIPFTTHEPILFFAFSGGLGYWKIFAAAATGSFCSGTLGWAIGHGLGWHPRMKRMMLRYRIGPFLHQYGVWAIAVAATTPFPFAIATWGAGAAGVPWRDVLLGSLFRIPKVLFYLTLISVGWSVGG